MTVADILDKAADILKRKGAWGQAAGPAAGSHCADTAICEVRRRARLPLEMADEARIALARQIGLKSSFEFSIWDWNDAPERTQSEVVAKLREAAAVARERGL